MPLPADTPSEVKAQTLADLRAVRTLLSTPPTPNLHHAWRRGNYCIDSCYCLSGAIDRACGNLPGDDCKSPRARRVMNALGFESNMDIIDWNDLSTTIFDTVMARIDAAIASIS